ncbi:hypothetical protein Trydic_g4001 [Trypoxylus dichotomus]
MNYLNKEMRGALKIYCDTLSACELTTAIGARFPGDLPDATAAFGGGRRVSATDVGGRSQTQSFPSDELPDCVCFRKDK